jgi:hypothetical protein
MEEKLELRRERLRRVEQALYGGFTFKPNVRRAQPDEDEEPPDGNQQVGA